jgi:hypothetical protein
MVSNFLLILGIVILVIGLILAIVEIKSKFELFYGFGDSAIGTNAAGPLAAGIALIAFRNGVNGQKTVITFIIAEIVIISLYFVVRSKLSRKDSL